jgi:glycosyltransferase involved in cell wall biosynthesis
MPCYDEEAIVGQTIRRLLQAFERAEIPIELVAVDNGSTDRTLEILQNLAERHHQIVVCRVAVNEGYGNGVLRGLPLCRAPWVGIIPADGQVDAEDTVRLFEDAVATGEVVLAKARRRFRMDGLNRKFVSIGYNLFFRLLWPGIASLDINGLPKIMPREVIQRLSQMASRSRNHDTGASAWCARARVQCVRADARQRLVARARFDRLGVRARHPATPIFTRAS